MFINENPSNTPFKYFMHLMLEVDLIFRGTPKSEDTALAINWHKVGATQEFLEEYEEKLFEFLFTFLGTVL